MKKILWLVIFLAFFRTKADQFIYPVADLQENNQLILLYQKSLDEIELWFWNTTNHYAIKGLSSFMKPTNIRILPSGKGFSFIDQGFIKIKEFAKRSATTLPIYESIGLFSHMNWIDDENFYFVARQGNFFQVFQGDLQAHVYPLTYDAADALYPQYINSQLFYIKRTTENNNFIMRQIIEPKYTHDDIEKNSIIFGPTSNQICFLHMINDTEGFYLQAPYQKVKNLNQSYQFSCHRFYKDCDTWKSEILYEFGILAKYITGQDRLYESIEPFLPHYTEQGFIYFVSWHEETAQFKVFQYQIATKTVQELSNSFLPHSGDAAYIFTPYKYNNILHCGMILQPNCRFQKMLEHNECIMFDLPTCNLEI